MHILIAESAGFSVDALARLRACADVTARDLQRTELLTAVPAADVLWVRLRNRIDAEVFDAAPNLKIVVTNTTGLNHIDLDEAQRRGIEVLSLRGEQEFLADIRATAELTIGLMLALLRKIPQAAAHARDGGWQRDSFKGRELYGKTVGIVGYGRLGRIVARYLQAFDVRVLAADPHVDHDERPDYVELLPLEDVLATADIVSLHVNLCEQTQGFFGQRELFKMKPSAWLINTARGELVDEAALLAALVSGHIAGAALDVICDENERSTQPGNPLVRYAQEHDNLILTPHIGGNTHESLEKTEIFLADKLAARIAQLGRLS